MSEKPKPESIFPSIELFPKLTHVAHVIGDLLLNRHSIPNSGGAPLLDELLMSENIAGAYYQDELDYGN